MRRGTSSSCAVRAIISDRRIRADREIASLRILQRRRECVCIRAVFRCRLLPVVARTPASRGRDGGFLPPPWPLRKCHVFASPSRQASTPGNLASHRDIARHAIDRGFRKVLIFEDDADIRIGRVRLQARLREAMARLPDDWWGLFLGHIPLQAYPAGFHLLRARSGASHAYIASERLLFWLAGAEPMDPEVPVCRTIGASIDAALANLPAMYALFPMVATQRFTNDYRVDPMRDALGRPRKLSDMKRYRTFLICNMMRSAEAFAVLLAPWHWLTLEFFRKRSGQAFRRAARAIRASNGFDEEWYVRTYPDIADCGRLPLEHYLVDGIREGRRPTAAACLTPQSQAAPGVGRWRMAARLLRILRRIGRRNPNPP
jgi:hypothetical protein